jgi:hypothetical protein
VVLDAEAEAFTEVAVLCDIVTSAQASFVYFKVMISFAEEAESAH